VANWIAWLAERSAKDKIDLLAASKETLSILTGQSREQQVFRDWL